MLYDRVSVDEIASSMPSPDRFRQVDQALAAVQVKVTPRVRELLLHADELRSPNDRLDTIHLYRALREAGRAAERPVGTNDPSAMLYAAAPANEELPEGRSPPIA